MGGVGFAGYGASVAGYPHDYLTAACAVGLSAAELDEFLLRLDKTLRKAKAEGEKAGASQLAASPEDARVGTGTGTRTGVDLAAKASHNGTGAEPGLNGSQSQPETLLSECVEADCDSVDWDGVDS